ncbi:MAG: 4-hydroxythreonine-4-phosphate dehydrogenase PdxA, partial [Bacillota bacterium]
MSRRPVIAITCGEPAGIGPEISLRAAWELRTEANCVLIGDAALLSLIARDIDPAIRLLALSTQALRNSGLPSLSRDQLAVVDCPLAEPAVPGKLDRRNGKAVLQTLDVAIKATLQKQFDAIVTAPLQKSVINDAGV